MQYKSIKKDAYTNYSLPSVAMEYDGYTLESEIKGYTTLKVKDREMINVELETERPPGKDGSTIIGQTLPSRVIEVTYMLKADSNEEFQASYSKLIEKLLKQSDVPIRFLDEPTIYYHGRYNTSGDVPDDKNWVVSSFSIYCQDPYKYREPMEVTGQSVQVAVPSVFSMKPDEINVTIGSSTNKLIVTNVTTGRRIILNGSYAAGNQVRIRIGQNEVTRNGQNVMKDLDFTATDFHNFLVNTGDTITVNSGSTMKLTVRGRKL